MAGVDTDEVGSEAMSQSQMVRSEKNWEGGHKSAYIGNHQSD